MARIYEQHEYEAALEQVLAYMEHPPAPGTPADEAFTDLLECIRGYAPPAELPAPSGDHRVDLYRELEARLDALDARTRRKIPEHGIGPTLGMDVSHS